MNLRTTFLTVLVLSLSLGAPAAVWYVDKDNTGAEDGTSWASAYNTIQEGIDAVYVAAGGEVWVAEGTYTAATNPVVTMKESVHLYGGFIGLGAGGNESTRDQRNWRVHVTIIDGENARRGIHGANNATLDGFTVTRGNAGNGGGMYNSSVSPTVTNCSFTANSAVSNGGGMYNQSSSANVINCSFLTNSANGDGGAMSNWSSLVTISNCTFSSNSANSDGGGMFNYSYSSPVITNCIFTDNSAGYDGGAIQNDDHCSPTVTKCTFSANQTGRYGGGMSNWVSSSPASTNCIFANNSATDEGGAVWNAGSSPTLVNCTLSGNSAATGNGIFSRDDGSSPTVTNCILWDAALPEISGPSTVTYSDIQGGYTGTGNINADPRFVNVSNGDLHLRGGSPCINTGTNAGAPPDDLEGQVRPRTGTVEMGAYESYNAPVITPLVPNLTMPVNIPKAYDLTPHESDTEDSGTGLNWTILPNDTTLYSAVIDSADVMTITPKLNQTGSQTATLTLTDSDGLTATQDISIKVGSSGPAAPVITTNGGANYSTNQSSLTLNGTCANDTNQIRVNGSASGVTYTAGQTTWTYTTTLAAGANVLSVTAVDAVGNISSPGSITVTLDTTPPSAPVIITNGGANFSTADVTVNLGGTCTTDTERIKVNGSMNGATYTPGGTTWSYTGTLSEGANLFSVVAEDAVGNPSNPDTITVTLIVERPNPPVITTHGGTNFRTNQSSLVLDGTCDAATQQIRVNGSTTGVTYTAGNTSWSYSAALSNGDNPFSVVAVGTANNESDPDTITITLDTLKPRVSSATAQTSTRVRVIFSEPMAGAAALSSPANYTFSGGGTALTASAVGVVDALNIDVTVNVMTPVANYAIIVSTAGPTDLAGNTVDLASNGDRASFTGFADLPPEPCFAATPDEGFVPLEVHFTDCSTNGPTEWKWDFDNDGDFDSFGQNPVYTYQSRGTYTVRLRVSKSSGFKEITKGNFIEVSGKSTRLSISVDPDLVKVGQRVVVQGAFDTSPSSPASTLAGKPIRLEYLLEDVVYDERTVTVDAGWGFSDEFSPPLPGQWTVRVWFDGDETLEPVGPESDKFFAQQVAGYAILIVGQISSSSGLSHHELTIQRVYRNLRNCGFDSGEIVIFAPDPARLLLEGTPIKEFLSKNRLRARITDWASQRMNAAPASLIIVMVDHGSQLPGPTFHIYNLLNSDPESPDHLLQPADLDAWLDELGPKLNIQAKTKPVVIVIGACYSGSFIAQLAQGVGELPRRIVITSAAADELSFKGPVEKNLPAAPWTVRDGELFVSQLFNALSLGRDLGTAFETAAEVMMRYTKEADTGSAANASPYRDGARQHALLEDSGDGAGTHDLLPNPPPSHDGPLAKTVRLSLGGESNATRMSFVRVSPSITLAAGGAADAPSLWVTFDNPSAELATRRWLEVKQPNFAVDVDDPERPPSEQPGIDNLQKIAPDSVGVEGSRTTLYWSAERMKQQDFSVSGAYEVIFFVANDQGDFAPPVQTFVYRPLSGPNQPPQEFDLLYPLDNVPVNEAVILHWESSADPEGGPITYTLEVMPASPGLDPILVQGLTTSYYLFPEPGDTYEVTDLRDGQSYTWTVYAYDQYGARTQAAETRRMNADLFGNPVPDTGNALIVLEDALNFRRITSAEVFLGSAPVPHVGNGEYLMTSLPANGTPEFAVVSAQGYYVPTSVSVTIFENAVSSATLPLAPDCQVDVEGIEPASGPCEGGNEVAVTGSNFREGDTRVSFGNIEVSPDFVEIVSPTELRILHVPEGPIVVVDKAGNETVDVVVQTCGESAVLTNAYTYLSCPCGDTYDINNDCRLDAVEVQLVINGALGLNTGYDCDLNDDGTVDAVDVQLMINAVLGLG
ncbi:MAG: PKD domain-containing protein [Candidatus Hydrogenedentes bacterium]|nr:PKD domain-containing protein [Candidatus Hydrogenedentota bacterium]